MKNIFKILIVIILVSLTILFIRFFLGGSEDTWICTEGKWIKHGMPSVPMPAESCK